MPQMSATSIILALGLLLGLTSSAMAAPALDGANMSWPWALPFFGMLVSIACVYRKFDST
jgi:hypothetical protein